MLSFSLLPTHWSLRVSTGCVFHFNIQLWKYPLKLMDFENFFRRGCMRRNKTIVSFIGGLDSTHSQSSLPWLLTVDCNPVFKWTHRHNANNNAIANRKRLFERPQNKNNIHAFKQPPSTHSTQLHYTALLSYFVPLFKSFRLHQGL